MIGLFSNIRRVISADFHELKSIKGVNNSAIASIFCIKETLEKTLKDELEPVHNLLRSKRAKAKTTMCRLVLSCSLAVFPQSSKGAFHNPSCWQQNKRMQSQQLHQSSLLS
ncbi:hypothetical protein BIY23_04770 [Wolbachia pipientis]|uniref:Uncharacterized protein n=1 Tax=Wolbachia pipientis TaxID=955 RepID=A0A1E7QKG9_WOLPI|nr:hypothetical protein BIY23_04770 [Wolbachia pipientis]